MISLELVTTKDKNKKLNQLLKLITVMLHQQHQLVGE